MERLEAIVSGRVQGVSYRAFAVSNGVRLGLKGYAKNLGDGGVEVVCEGEKKMLLEFLSALQKGPPLSHVEKVTANWRLAKNEFAGFAVKH
ncbi:Acylphosphatase [uncultured archaeon]|nr:Acylphosphatase [uncultured archaeon]